MALAFLLAAATGDNTAIEASYTSNPSILSATNPDGRNALHLATFHFHRDTVRLLLSFSSNNNKNLSSQKDKYGQTSLHIAAQGSSPEIVDLLLKSDDDTACSARDNDGKTAIFYAYQNPCLDVLAHFLSSANTCGSGCALTPEVVLRSPSGSGCGSGSGATDYFGSAVSTPFGCGRPAATASASKCCVKTQS
ncbi:ankyrin repeat domain-containing protein [Aspergillus undulatus]|uniref:ankyrin repeat domain-containing protein n=1 Tax=Aspergillus undulatus TaxID=1810928 RepID=UPI003CCDF429